MPIVSGHLQSPFKTQVLDRRGWHAIGFGLVGLGQAGRAPGTTAGRGGATSVSTGTTAGKAGAASSGGGASRISTRTTTTTTTTGSGPAGSGGAGASGGGLQRIVHPIIVQPSPGSQATASITPAASTTSTLSVANGTSGTTGSGGDLFSSVAGYLDSYADVIPGLDNATLALLVAVGAGVLLIVALSKKR